MILLAVLALLNLVEVTLIRVVIALALPVFLVAFSSKSGG